MHLSLIPSIGGLPDVTKRDQIDAAVDLVKTHLSKNNITLQGIVNNAGVGFMFPMEIVPDENLRYMWEGSLRLSFQHFGQFRDANLFVFSFDGSVNYFGLVNVTRAFLPLLRDAPEERRRIIFIGSLSSFGLTKFFASYPAAKAAVELTADELRRELAPWGIKVTVLEPGIFHTKFTKNTAAAKEALDKLLATGSTLAKNYETPYMKFWQTATYPPTIPGNSLSKVAREIDYALRARFPPAKRGVGVDAHALQALALFIPDSVLDFAVRYIL